MNNAAICQLRMLCLKPESLPHRTDIRQTAHFASDDQIAAFKRRIKAIVQTMMRKHPCPGNAK